jgi:hypothetical protein
MLHFKTLRKKTGISHLGIMNSFLLYVDILGKRICWMGYTEVSRCKRMR